MIIFQDVNHVEAFFTESDRYKEERLDFIVHCTDRLAKKENKE